MIAVSIPLGIVIGLLASFVQSLGLTIQRKSHVQNEQLPESQQRQEHRRPLWLLGFAIFISSNILGSLIQIASLPVVILAPLGAVSLLWNAFFARVLLGDIFSPWMVLGTILIAGGAILIAFFGIVPEQTRSLEDLLQLFRRPAFIAYFSTLGFIVFISLVATHIVEYSLSQSCKDAPCPETPDAIFVDDPLDVQLALQQPTADEVTNSTEQTPLLDYKLRNPSPPRSPSLSSIARTRVLLAVSYASFSGIISGMCLIFAKSGVELLMLTLGGHNQFWRWESWVLLLGLGVFALLQLWYLHKALVLADPTLVCPSAFCFYNLSSIVNGLVYFNQFSLIRPLYLALVSLGIAVLLAGVWVVSIQSGGAGVDIMPWTEEDINLTSHDVAEAQTSDDEETSALPETSSRGGTVQSQGGSFPPPPAIERMTQSESSLPKPSLPIISDRKNRPGFLDLDQRRGQSNRSIVGLYPAVRSPSHSARAGRRQATEDGYSASPGDGTRSAGHPHTPHVHYGHRALSPPIPTPGFQIGLSPVSPGFTIMPMDRRRTSASLADVAHDLMRRRRALSEGESTRGSRIQVSLRDDNDSLGGHDDEEALVAEALPSSNGVVLTSGKSRWGWLRRVFKH